MIVYAGLLALTWFGFKTVPSAFIPTQDSGYLVVFAQLGYKQYACRNLL